ncbi:MAG: glycoside hydrolase family 20 zincin-like fold domain-containing protein [Candidatus Hydrogenedentes bacterium]|nr:glycoside hydrolase family 20 zincin-like fold domain-containing protein [Candidatus Hydrogenedentota bacterium]
MNAFALACLMAALELVPRPKEMELKRGTFGPREGQAIVLPDEATATEEAMAQEIGEAAGVPFAVVRASQHKGRDGIFLGEPRRQPALTSWLMRRRTKGTGDLAPEGYFLEIWGKGAAVVGTDAQGTFNGVQTLLQIARQAPGAWPELEIRDWPQKRWRGVRGFQHCPSAQELQELANYKVNLVFFQDSLFYTPNDPRAAVWQAAFEAARQWHITAIPVISIFSGATPLLYEAPQAVEGETATEQVILTGAGPVVLAHRNIIDTPESPLTVQVSGFRCEAGRDYTLLPGVLQAPYYPLNAPWVLQRVAGGNIPSGATASITYSHAPQGASSLCPNAAETHTAVVNMITALAARFQPTGVCWDARTVERINRDQRCRAKALSDADCFIEAIHLLQREWSPASAFVAADALLPGNPLSDAAAKLPEELILLVTAPQDASAGRELWQWLTGLNRPFLPIVTLEEPSAWLLSSVSETSAAQGIVLDTPDTHSEQFRAAINTAW